MKTDTKANIKPSFLGQANQAAVHWDRWLREREASGRDEF